MNPLSNDSELQSKLFKMEAVLDIIDGIRRVGGLAPQTIDAIMQLFAQRLQLTVLEGRKEEASKAIQVVENHATDKDQSGTINTLANRLTALNKQIEGLK